MVSAYFHIKMEEFQKDNKRLRHYIQEAQENISVALGLIKLNDIEGAKDLLIDIYNELDRTVM